MPSLLQCILPYDISLFVISLYYKWVRVIITVVPGEVLLRRGTRILHRAEGRKFTDDNNSSLPIQDDPTKRFLPLAANQFGRRRGWHYQALLEELAEFSVTRPTGCRLLTGTFAFSETGAVQHVLRKWGSRLTWNIERAHAINTCKAMSEIGVSFSQFTKT